MRILEDLPTTTVSEHTHWMLRHSRHDNNVLRKCMPASMINDPTYLSSGIEEYRLAIQHPEAPFKPLDNDLVPHLVCRDSVLAGAPCLQEILDLTTEIHRKACGTRRVQVTLADGEHWVHRDALVIWLSRPSIDAQAAA